MSGYFTFGDTIVEEETIENAVNKVIKIAANVLPRECICVAVLEEIFEKSKYKIRTIPIETFRQYLEANKQ